MWAKAKNKKLPLYGHLMSRLGHGPHWTNVATLCLLLCLATETVGLVIGPSPVALPHLPYSRLDAVVELEGCLRLAFAFFRVVDALCVSETSRQPVKVRTWYTLMLLCRRM